MNDGPGTTRSVMTCARETRLVTSVLDIASWLKRPPSAEEVRPAHCPACGAASRVLGQPLGLRSHGLRQRRVRGSLGPGEPLVTLTIHARRYLCRCGAVTLVVPAGRRRALPRALSRTRLAWGRAVPMLTLLLSAWGLQAPTNSERIVRNSAKPPGALARPRRWLLSPTHPATPSADLVAATHAPARLQSVRRREQALADPGNPLAGHAFASTSGLRT
jgi:hypothetical protein